MGGFTISTGENLWGDFYHSPKRDSQQMLKKWVVGRGNFLLILRSKIRISIGETAKDSMLPLQKIGMKKNPIIFLKAA